MRKVTSIVVRSFLQGKPKTCGNTHTDGEHLFLYGNLIAMKCRGGVRISSAGYRTVTTKERLNGLMEMIGGPHISQIEGVWYQAGEVFVDEVFVPVREAA